MATAVRQFLDTYPAIRLQHRPDYPVGKGLRAWQDAEGATHLEALIVDENAKRMVRRQVLRAFSVGLADVETQKSARAPRWEIVGFRLAEVSVVDSPSNARCGIRVVGKSAGGTPGYIGKAFGVAKVRKPSKIEKAAQRFSGDPVGFHRWLGKYAEAEREKSLHAFLAETVNTTDDPQARETARAVLGRYGLS